jgi:hypothetical protein
MLVEGGDLEKLKRPFAAAIFFGLSANQGWIS